jgi:hypothetical protein
MELVPDAGAPLIVVHNFSESDRQARVPSTTGGSWSLRLTTEEARYGGECPPPRSLLADSTGELAVPIAAHSSSLYRRSVE